VVRQNCVIAPERLVFEHAQGQSFAWVAVNFPAAKVCFLFTQFVIGDILKRLAESSRI
jgi:hypothetical protein